MDIAPSAHGLEQGGFTGTVFTHENGDRAGQFDLQGLLKNGQIERICVLGGESILINDNFIQMHSICSISPFLPLRDRSN